MRRPRTAAAAMAAALAIGACPSHPPRAAATPPEAHPAAEFLATRHGGQPGHYSLVYERQASVHSVDQPL
ncbi:MAG TPA: hypothetical protein VHK63_00835, partial [Candidatus Limnocylindria bacterium]|nr:hypothetical protein [Candidatus Limnocylindria bacterium]